MPESDSTATAVADASPTVVVAQAPQPAAETVEASTEPLPVRAAEAQAAWARTSGRLTDQVVLDDRGGAAGGECAWRLVTFSHLDDVALAAIAWYIADQIMTSRFGPATIKYNAWRAASSGEGQLTPSDQVWFHAYTETVFGRADDPKDPQHTQGHVSEWLWYLLTKESADPARTVRYLEAPKFQVTDGGGDGFVVYARTQGDHIFRLWEIKKHDAVSTNATDVVRVATDQLLTKGAKYLAQLTKPLGDAGLPELGDPLVDWWIAGDPRAGAGVAVASSQTATPDAPFGPLEKKLEMFAAPGQLEGILSVASKFVSLCETVRRYVWTTL